MDAARAFGTGCFKDHRTHDLRGLSESEIKASFGEGGKEKRLGLIYDASFFSFQSVEHWKKFFRDHQSYVKVGRVSHAPIDPSTPLPPHCDAKKDVEQNARWGRVGVPPADHPAASAAASVVAAVAQENEAKVEPDPDAKSGRNAHEEL